MVIILIIEDDAAISSRNFVFLSVNHSHFYIIKWDRARASFGTLRHVFFNKKISVTCLSNIPSNQYKPNDICVSNVRQRYFPGGAFAHILYLLLFSCYIILTGCYCLLALSVHMNLI